MSLLQPEWLWLLPVVALLTAFDLARPGSRRATLVRPLVLALGVLALAQPGWRQADAQHVDVVVIDRSASVPGAELDRALAEGAADGAALVVFDGLADVVAVHGQRCARQGSRS